MSSVDIASVENNLSFNNNLLEENCNKKLCRICLREENDLIFIFSMEKKYNKTYAELLMEIAPVIILEENKIISPDVCTICVESLCNSYQFQQQCIKADSIIRAQQEKIIFKIENDLVNNDKINQYNFNKSEEKIQRLSRDRNHCASEDVKPYLCFTCNIAYNSLNKLNEHLKIVHGNTKKENFEHQTTIEKPKRVNIHKELIKRHCKSRQNYCDTCNKSYTSYRYLLQHLRRVHKPDKTSCSICHKVFPNKKFLKKHKHVCENCGKYSEEGDMSNHVCLIHSNKKVTKLNERYNQQVAIKCEQKNRIRFSKDLVRQHCKTKLNHCDTCNKSYTSYRYILQHLRRVHTPNKTSCEVCNKIFPSKKFLRKHKHICEFCGEYSETGDLSNHDCSNHLKKSTKWDKTILIRESIKLHCKTKPNHCDTCNKTYKTYRYLLRHINSSHVSAKFPCDICNKLFYSKSNLARHTKTHFGIKEFSCEQCNKKFTRKSYLSEHIYIHHTEEAPKFKCFLCEKVFKGKSAFRLHQTYVHSGRSSQCWICGKQVSGWHMLNAHVNTHSEVKPHTCAFCPKTFAQRQHLQAHERTHTGERPFKCKFCTKTFRHRTSQTLHTRIHTGERPYECTICDKSFYHQTNMKRHLKLHLKQ